MGKEKAERYWPKISTETKIIGYIYFVRSFWFLLSGAKNLIVADELEHFSGKNLWIWPIIDICKGCLVLPKRFVQDIVYAMSPSYHISFSVTNS